MVLLRALAAVSAVAWISAVAVGCGSGLSKEDADQRCDQEKMIVGTGFGDQTYAQCEACFEKCGDNCLRVASNPVTYECPGDSDTGAGGASTSSSSSSSSGQ